MSNKKKSKKEVVRSQERSAERVQVMEAYIASVKELREARASIEALAIPEVSKEALDLTIKSQLQAAKTSFYASLKKIESIDSLFREYNFPEDVNRSVYLYTLRDRIDEVLTTTKPKKTKSSNSDIGDVNKPYTPKGKSLEIARLVLAGKRQEANEINSGIASRIGRMIEAGRQVVVD